MIKGERSEPPDRYSSSPHCGGGVPMVEIPWGVYHIEGGGLPHRGGVKRRTLSQPTHRPYGFPSLWLCRLLAAPLDNEKSNQGKKHLMPIFAFQQNEQRLISFIFAAVFRKEMKNEPLRFL